MEERTLNLRRHTASAVIGVALLSLVFSGCGGSDPEPSQNEAPPASAFPNPANLSIEQLAAKASPTDLQFAPSGKVFEPGKNRYGFAVFNPQGEQQTDLDVAIYATKGPKSKVLGPFPASTESLETAPAFRAQTTSEDPGAAKAVYVVSALDLPTRGKWFLLALAKTGSELIGSQLPNIVARESTVVRVGEKAPRTAIPTAADVGGNLEKIDTRIPPDSMHTADFRKVLGKKPVVLLFSTPQLCESRVCGPVVDVQAQVAEETGDGVEFIHSEIYNENDLNKGVNSQVKAFGLPTEPWLFAIDKRGVVRQRIEGAFGLGELREAVESVQGA
ncbi:MAG: thioredoxin family protein [Solirubrobacterales bacterium]|nr:thioredoxin family protein [Solirubrobacterales bacterium]OJU93385.1 MAG: hypothetical protein BGO23_12000 [Solirubrobacterales bacterium 67-14]